MSPLLASAPRSRALGANPTSARCRPSTLVGALSVFDCEIIGHEDLATHRVLFGKVVGMRIGENLHPLLYYNRGYRELGAPLPEGA